MPIVDRSKDSNDVDLRHDVLPVHNLLNKDGMFQNRQSTRTRIEKLKQTSSLFRLQKYNNNNNDNNDNNNDNDNDNNNNNYKL